MNFNTSVFSGAREITTPMPMTAPVSSDRLNFVFSGNGCYGACVKIGDADLTLERWTLISEQTRCETIRDVVVNHGTRPLPLDDGQILLFHPGRSGSPAGRGGSGRPKPALVQRVDGDFRLQELGKIPGGNGHLLPSPTPEQLGFVISFDDRERTTIWRLPAPTGPAEPLMQVPGFLTGGVWLDARALVLGINQTFGGSRSRGIVVDLARGSWKRIWSASDTSNDQILLYSALSKLVIVSSNVSGQQRLGWARLGDRTVHFPELMHRPGYPRQALVLDDLGERLLVHEVTGATSQLLVYIPMEDRLEIVMSPLGRISAPASWTGDLIRFRFSAPDHTPTLATVRLRPQSQWSFGPGRKFDVQSGGAQATLIKLPGRTGPIEAIVYGGPDWWQRECLVVALHGGPLSSWRFGFEPLFHCLSVQGAAVVAPNYRGSIGYGDEHLRAVIGNWGGPDLDDVLDLGRSLERDRGPRQLPRPVVLGMGYGAFLALLAVCQEPQLWSACVALAPFLSGPRFHDSANDAVRRRIKRLGGLRQVNDATGPRDILSLCDALSAPLLLMHGIRDDTIPVEQSRTLRQRLLRLGRTEGVDVEYVEVDSDHTGLLLGQCTERNQRVVRFCLTRSALDSSLPGRHRGLRLAGP